MSAPTNRVAVIGAGASALVLDLVRHGYRSIDAVDLSAAALAQLRGRLGDAAASVRFVHADVRQVVFDGPIEVWHDRATFHFLTAAADRAAYVAGVEAAVVAGGHLVVATFAEDGPQQCSGLPVARYSEPALAAQFVAQFDLVDSFMVDHVTPWGAHQPFTYAVLR
ncbi:MAG: class I SAM-dependent methyltransferase, partial [Ilumatobacteraceae bacterium]